MAPWKQALKVAKRQFRRHVFLNHGFPARDLHLKEAASLIKDTVEDMMNEDPNLVFEPGIISFVDVCIRRRLKIQIAAVSTRDMQILVCLVFLRIFQSADTNIFRSLRKDLPTGVK